MQLCLKDFRQTKETKGNLIKDLGKRIPKVLQIKVVKRKILELCQMIKKDLIVFTLVNIKIQIMISKFLTLMLNVKGRLFSYLSLLKGIKAIKLKIISKGPKRQESN